MSGGVIAIRASVVTPSSSSSRSSSSGRGMRGKYMSSRQIKIPNSQSASSTLGGANAAAGPSEGRRAGVLVVGLRRGGLHVRRNLPPTATPVVRGGSVVAAASATAGYETRQWAENDGSDADASTPPPPPLLYPHLDLDFKPRLTIEEHVWTFLAAALAAAGQGPLHTSSPPLSHQLNS